MKVVFIENRHWKALNRLLQLSESLVEISIKTYIINEDFITGDVAELCDYLSETQLGELALRFEIETGIGSGSIVDKLQSISFKFVESNE